MKKLFNLSALILMLSLAACAPSEVDDLFDESAAVRLDNAIKNYTEYFQSNGGRWLMQYFANADEEGYNFIMTFNSDGSVKISAQNEFVNDGTFTSDVSLWQVVADYGPVLSFNTYNKAFHVFTSPEDIPSTSADEQGKGHEGDYEFLIMKTEDNKAMLRGKKSGIDIVMTRLGTDVAPSDEDYFTSLNSFRNKAFSARLGDYVLTTPSGRRYFCNDVTYMLWSFYPEGGTPLDNGEYMNAIMTLDGIRFMEPLEFINEYNQDDIAVQNFVFQPDGTLLCTDDNATTISGPDMPDAFLQTTVTWTIDKDNIGGEFAEAYANIVAVAKSVYKQTFNWIQFRYDSTKKKYGIYFRNGRYYGNIYVTPVKVDKTTLRFEFDPTADDAFDANGRAHYNNMPGMQTIVRLLTSSEYTMSAQNLMVPNPVVLTSKANSSNYITVGF